MIVRYGKVDVVGIRDGARSLLVHCLILHVSKTSFSKALEDLEDYMTGCWAGAKEDEMCS